MSGKIEIFYGKASKEDFPLILDLQKRNLIQNLTNDQRLNGFLSIEFTNEMLEQVIQDIPIIKAFTKDKIIGYRMAQSLEFNLRFPLVSKIIERFPITFFQTKPISDYRAFISGPTCIDESFRGLGIYEGLFKEMMKAVKTRFEIGVTFISESNKRSLAAATKKLGMEVIDKITFNENSYIVLSFLVPK